MIISVAEMSSGQSGIVIEMAGGRGMVRRMQAMGVRPGVVVTKLTTQPFRGPVSAKVGSTQIALGFGLARRIMVKVPG